MMVQGMMVMLFGSHRAAHSGQVFHVVKYVVNVVNGMNHVGYTSRSATGTMTHPEPSHSVQSTTSRWPGC